MKYNAEYLRQARKGKGYSTNMMAEKLNMDRGNYTKLENGRYKNIPLDILVKLNEVLKIDLYYLLNIKA